MIDFDSLSQTEQAILRILFFAPNHAATAAYVAEHSYYPDSDVEAALNQLIGNGSVVALSGANDKPTYGITSAMLTQLRRKNQQADANLQAALANAKQLMEDYERGNGESE